jgi:hypothetical protein
MELKWIWDMYGFGYVLNLFYGVHLVKKEEEEEAGSMYKTP